MDRLREYLNQLKEIWDNLNTRGKIITGTVAGAVLFGLLFLVFRSPARNYQPLFQQLTPEDASAIVEELETRDVNYQLAEDGQTIMVPADDVHRMRLEMAAEGLPEQGLVGFEIFDETQFGTTDFERRVNLYRAMGGEISRSIQSMNNIAMARVQITAPEESLFIDEERPAKASVMLELEPNVELSESQARAIANLVSSSVPDLQPDNVTIVDTAGNLLSPQQRGEELDIAEGTSEQRELERDYADRLKSELNAMLTRILGPDNFTVQVSARMNFDQRERESMTYLPVIDDEEGIPRSRQEMVEMYRGEELEDGGVPGTTSNIPGYEAIEEMEDGSYQRSETIINYEMDEIFERETFAPGSLELLSVSVMIDDEMEEDELLALEQSIQAAIGYEEERGDTVNVASMDFDRTLEEEMELARAQAEEERQRQMMMYAILIGVVLVITAITIFILRRRTGQEAEPVPEGARVDMMVDDEEEEEVELPEEELSEEEKKLRKMRDELKEIAEEQPEEIADLLKSWLME